MAFNMDLKECVLLNEVLDVVVHFSFAQSSIKHYINLDILTKLYFYVCRGKRL